MPRPPLISVVIPAFNAVTHLQDTLATVQAQTWSHLEIIVVDDGSTDGTVRLVQAAARHDPRIRLIPQRNAGVGAARNTGLRAARGKYVAPLDADDLWAPAKLERQVLCLERAGPGAGLAYCWSRNIDAGNRVISWAHPSRIEGRAGAALLLGNFIGNASVPLFRASALAMVGDYLTRTEQHGEQGCEDWDLNLRLAEKFRICCVPEYLVSYRQCVSGMSHNARGMLTSYEVTMQRAQVRNPELPPMLLAWSASRFYAYLVSKCYGWGDYAGTLRYLAKMLRIDAATLLNPRTHRIAALAVAHLLSGGKLRRHPSPPAVTAGSDPLFQTQPPTVPPGDSVFERIQTRRLELALRVRRARHGAGMSMCNAYGC